MLVKKAKLVECWKIPVWTGIIATRTNPVYCEKKEKVLRNSSRRGRERKVEADVASSGTHSPNSDFINDARLSVVQIGE